MEPKVEGVGLLKDFDKMKAAAGANAIPALMSSIDRLEAQVADYQERLHTARSQISTLENTLSIRNADIRKLRAYLRTIAVAVLKNNKDTLNDFTRHYGK